MNAASIDIDVNVNLHVPCDTAETCVRILNQFFKNNPGYYLSEHTDDRTEVHSYEIVYAF